MRRVYLSGENYFFDKKSQYDWLALKTYWGLRYQRGRSKLTIMPFYQYHLAGSNAWSASKKTVKNRTFKMSTTASALGLAMNYEYHWLPQVKLGTYIEGSEKRSRVVSKKYSEAGWNFQETLYAFYQPSSQNNFSLNITAKQFRPKQWSKNGVTNPNRYHELGFGVSWQHHWQGLYGTMSEVSYQQSKRNYSGAFLDFEHSGYFSRSDKTSHFSLTVWNPKLEVQGFTPKFKFTQYNNHSSHYWADREKRSFFVYFDRKF